MTHITPPPSTIEDKNHHSWTKWFYDIYDKIGDEAFELESSLVANLPSAANLEGHILYVSDESGGATVAFSDGTDWRRVQDRAIVS
jgi:hypothetical protein